MIRIENSKLNKLVDDFGNLIISILQNNNTYTYKELHQEDKDTNTIYLSQLGEEIHSEAVNEVEILLRNAEIKREEKKDANTWTKNSRDD